MPNSLITSRIAGRLRIRDDRLRNASWADEQAALLRSWPGVRSVEANPVTGGLLLHYDVSVALPEEMERMIEAHFLAGTHLVGAAIVGEAAAGDNVNHSSPRARRKALSQRDVNRYAKIGMLGTLGASLLALGAGKRLHAAFGVAYLGFLGVHLVVHRKKMMQ